MSMKRSMRMPGSKSRLALAAAVPALLTLAAGAAAQAQEQAAATADPRLLAVTRSLETDLRNGRSARALRLTRETLDELTRTGPATIDAPTLARLLYYQAVAAADRGLSDTAAWSWSLAQSLDAELSRENLGPWGEAGAFLAARLARPPETDGDVAPDDGRPRRSVNLFDAPEGVTTRLPQEADAPPPRYPPALRGSGIRGTVLLQVRIDRQGRTNDPMVLESPHPLLALAAAQSVVEWRYRPAQLDGDEVAVYYRVRIDFRAE